LSKYCPTCKHNFSNQFDECVYCGAELKVGTIETEDFVTEKQIYEMSDAEILKKYTDYRERIEDQIGRKMTDYEFLVGIRQARQDSLNIKANNYSKKLEEVQINIPKCPTCQSVDVKKISVISKTGSVALWGVFSQKVKKQWHCNNCGSEW
jgi:hypothetical protein